MIAPEIERLRSIKDFPTLVAYLRDELDWPIEEGIAEEDMVFDYAPEEVGLDPASAVKIERIVRLRPLVSGQPWGIFYIDFKPGKLPITVLRRILRALVVKKRTGVGDKQTWQLGDLLFVSTLGESESRGINLAHFSDEGNGTGRAVLRVVDWDEEDTHFHILRNVDELHRLRWPADPTDVDRWRETWSSAFALKPGEVAKTSKQLAVEMARLARLIRGRVNAAMAIESESGPLRGMYKAFQEVLLHDLKEDDFADMYAQTITYGLFAARRSRPMGITAENARDMIPKTNPFLSDLLAEFTEVGGITKTLDFDELGIDALVDMLNRANMEAIVADIGDKTRVEDPVIYFYELFLKEYDARKKVQRGIFFTPRAVVSFMVRSVDEILRTEFGLEDGLADRTTWSEMRQQHPDLKLPPSATPDTPFVQILDPAVGTGTFLVEVIDVIHRTMMQKWRRQGHLPMLDIPQLWNDYVANHLLPRLYGFELMMAPYAIAHMKVGLKLDETGYRFASDERLRIYLTNTLEEPKDFSGQFEVMAPALAHEALAANTVKRDVPITVIVGNPPYAVNSANKNSDIDKELSVYKTSLQDEKNLKPLNDDYVKFLRYAHLQVLDAGTGIIGMITNHSFATQRLFRSMRRALMSDFSSVRFLDLHGETSRDPALEADKNVFDIQQGVGVSLIESAPTKRAARASVWQAELIGPRERKDSWLDRNKCHDVAWTAVEPEAPHYQFCPRELDGCDEYSAFIPLVRMFSKGNVGYQTHRDAFVVDFDQDSQRNKLRTFRSADPDEKALEQHFGLRSNRDWSLTVAHALARADEQLESCIVPTLYRPFDTRYIAYSPYLIDYDRSDLLRHMLAPNLGLLVSKVFDEHEFTSVFVTRLIVESKVADRTRGSYVFPLYLVDLKTQDLFENRMRHSSRTPNLDTDTVKCLLAALHGDAENDQYRSSVTPEDVLHYVYAILYSPAYRSRYLSALKTDFPRIPLTSDAALFRDLSTLGSDLVALHLLEPEYPEASWNRSSSKGNPFDERVVEFEGGNPVVFAGFPKHANSRVSINPSGHFSRVPEDAWNFHIGGYQVCEKWLKDRRGHVLSEEDIRHYQRIVVALSETIRLMGEIDEVIEAHGGWPDAFQNVAGDQAP